MNNYALLVLAALACASYAKKFPDGWIACKMDDPKHNECMRGAIQRTLPDLVKGMPQFGIKTIDPLTFKQIVIKQGNGPISLDLTLDDFDILGIHTGNVDRVLNNKWKSFVANVSVPKLTATAKHYKMDGKMLVLPIKGEGKAKMVLDDFKAGFLVDVGEETKGGKTYYKMTKMHIDLDCSKFSQDYENLFDGNKQLADQMKIFLSENHKEVFRELAPALGEALSAGLLELGNRLFSKIPKDEITPK
uniref:Protein takeout n=1 Tax=Lygus hesperus TaxID=30085 RepID=A0A0A9YG68_LYGHE